MVESFSHEIAEGYGPFGADSVLKMKHEWRAHEVRKVSPRISNRRSASADC
jgi:hypothetical protein